RPPLQRPSNRLSGCAPWKSGYSRDTRSRSRRRAGRLGIFCRPRTNRHDGELEIGAGRLLRNNARGHAENRRAARDVGNHNRVRAHHDVVADRDRSDDLTTGPEIAIVSNSRTTDATHVHNAGSLIESATMANLFRQDENATKIMDNQTRPDVAFGRDVNAGDDHARDIDEEIESNKNLADDRDFDLVGPRTEAIDEDGEGAELEKRCDSFTKKSLIFRANTESGGLAAKIGTNVFKHTDAYFGLLEIAKSLEAFLDFGSLFVGVTARTIGPGGSGSRSSPDRVRRKKLGVK